MTSNDSLRLALLAAPLVLVACSAPRSLDERGRNPGIAAEAASLTVEGSGGSQHVDANWKERLAQPYVFVEHRGDYRRMGDSMRRLFQAAEQAGIAPDGEPFALFYDDPGRTPLEGLRARACLPVATRPARLGELTYEVLPRAMVVYARVTGAYPQVARSYPALFSYLSDLGWQAGGPVREVYLVDPGSVQSFDELVTEVQIPWSAAP